LFVRISSHASSPGMRSNPQDGGDVSFDMPKDESRFGLKYTQGSQKEPFFRLSDGNPVIGSTLRANYSPAFFFV
jgi:hypothetical protein